MSDNIPIEVQMDIIRRLPVKCVAQCRSVCKLCKACVDTLHFTARFVYLQRWKGNVNFVDQNFSLTPLSSNINFTDLEPIGWSHGVWGFIYGPIVRHWIGFVWNPSIKRSVGTFIPYVTLAQEYEKRFLAFRIRPDNLDPTMLKISFPFNP
ncbi:F-box domain-containing protein [Artemisia annua]|uniref:F-box domain-containing protein n=1 Tax=Artemisia annua TaxID=35608 RepID=A0A2U1N2X4_ARTAN|nr:F-box domain-containing protein [Artemisia annua]